MKTTTVQLGVKTQTGSDPFGVPTYSYSFIDVPGVLVGQPSAEERLSTLDLCGKYIAYTLGIPKGDDHDWNDTEVIIWGERFRTIGFPETGIQENIPLRWGKNIKVERYG